MNVERFEKPFFLALCVLAFILVLLVFLPEVNALILGAAFAIFFHPIYVRLSRKMPGYEWLAALFTVLIAAIVIVVPLFVFGYQLFSEAEGLYAHLAAGGITSLESMISERLGSVMRASQSGGVLSSFNVNFGQYVTQAVGGIVSNAGSILSSIGGVVWTFFLAFFAFFYLLKDGEKFRKLIVRGMPLADDRAEEIVERLVGMATSVVRGSLFMAIVWGLVVGIEFLVFGVPNPVFWGAISILAAFIPVIGVSLIIVPGILYVGAHRRDRESGYFRDHRFRHLRIHGKHAASARHRARQAYPSFRFALERPRRHLVLWPDRFVPRPPGPELLPDAL